MVILFEIMCSIFLKRVVQNKFSFNADHLLTIRFGPVTPHVPHAANVVSKNNIQRQTSAASYRHNTVALMTAMCGRRFSLDFHKINCIPGLGPKTKP